MYIKKISSEILKDKVMMREESCKSVHEVTGSQMQPDRT